MARVFIPGFRKIETSGGGEGGTTNYNELDNKPSINNVPLVGNLNTVDLKLTDATLTEEGVPAEAKTVGAKLEEHSTSLTEFKEEFDNLEIGGRNLLVGTKDFSGGKWVKNEYYETVSETYKGLTVKKTMLEWAGISQIIEVNEGCIYTLSAYVKSSYSKVYAFTQQEGSATSNPNSKVFTVVPDTWQRLSITFEATTSGTLRPRFENPEKGESIYICGLKLEKGNKATDWTPAPEDTEAEIQAVDNKLTTNLLKPTLETTTKNGVTCTNNGDGTYTLNGTASGVASFTFYSTLQPGKYKAVGCPSNGNISKYTIQNKKTNQGGEILAEDSGNGAVFELSEETIVCSYIRIESGYSCDNLVFKPMLTTNLNADYSMFVPYTGRTGQINSDVSSLLKRIEALESLTNKTTTTTVESE